MLVTRIGEVGIPCFNKIQIIEKNKPASVFLVLHAGSIWKLQNLLRIVVQIKIKINISYPAGGIIQKTFVFNIDNLRTKRYNKK